MSVAALLPVLKHLCNQTGGAVQIQASE